MMSVRVAAAPRRLRYARGEATNRFLRPRRLKGAGDTGSDDAEVQAVEKLPHEHACQIGLARRVPIAGADFHIASDGGVDKLDVRKWGGRPIANVP
jgi:hypothetical protein